MKQFILFAGFFILTTSHSAAQGRQDEHLLDGSSFDIFYESGSRIHVEFTAGQIISKWIAGPGQDNASGQESYKSKKMGDKIYIINWLKTPSHSFCTQVLNFNQNVSWASAFRGVGTSNEAIYLEGATIENLHLHEK